jgi:hypothetical protein
LNSTHTYLATGALCSLQWCSLSCTTACPAPVRRTPPAAGLPQPQARGWI